MRFAWLLIIIGWVLWAPSGVLLAAECQPTPPDALGPFYKPGAPERSSVGKGYLLEGRVLSSPTCSPIANSRIEFWLAAPDGDYDDAHRATVLPDRQGIYGFESNYPPRYGRRPPHIHIRVSAPGFRTLVTQHYPDKGRNSGHMDLVLQPETALPSS
jgi:protocatechuate 3,4-dioxygenase beta subunit